VQPADLFVQMLPLDVRDGVKETGQPVGYQRERGNEQDEDCGTVLRVLIDTPRHPHEPQETGCLEHPRHRHRLPIT